VFTATVHSLFLIMSCYLRDNIIAVSLRKMKPLTLQAQSSRGVY